MDDLKELKAKIEKSINYFQQDLATIRVGKATAAVLDKIDVNYYGAETPINQIATISSPDSHTLTIQPWDASLIKEIEKSIQKSELGINPTDDGKLIRLNFPPLTEEHRKELVKTLNKKTEEAKVNVRNIRRDALEVFKKQKKEGIRTEDVLANVEKDVQKVVDDAIKDVETIAMAKEKSIMAI
ncbi:MAG: ribosome recycling factor [Bacillota bacterium]|nr:ribosome recycling factor [Bacillota bacterium]